MNLRTELIRIAKHNPELRGDLLPLLAKTAAKGQTTHMESDSKPGFTMCGEGLKYHSEDNIVDSVKDTTCYYCKLAWENSSSRKAGFDVEVQTVFLSLVPKKRNFPVNTDTVKDIQAQWVEIDGKGAVQATVLDMKTSRDYFTGPQEKMGARNETIVTLKVPTEAKAPLLRDIALILSPQFKVTVLPRYREPVSVQPTFPSQEDYVSPLSRRRRFP